MPLHDVQLVLASHDRAIYRALTPCWENVRNVFCAKLGGSLDLGKITKVNVYLGSEGPGAPHEELKGILACYAGAFEVDRFMAMAPDAQDEWALMTVETALTTVAEHLGVDAGPIHEAATDTRTAGFTHVTVSKKASKRHPGKAISARTDIIFRRGGGGTNVVLTIVDSDGTVLASENVATDQFWNGIRHGVGTGVWEGDRFVIRNRSGKVFYESEPFHGPGA